MPSLNPGYQELFIPYPAPGHPLIPHQREPESTSIFRSQNYKELQLHMGEVGISSQLQKVVNLDLEMTADFDIFTAEHMLRTGWLAEKILEIEIDEYPESFHRLLPGSLRISFILHDIGKTKNRHALITKKGEFTPDERIEVQSHTIDGEQILFEQAARVELPTDRLILMLGGHIAGRHHLRKREGGYPAVSRLRPVRGEFEEFFDDYLDVAELADNIDATMTRTDRRNEVLSGTVLINNLLTRLPDQEERILRISGSKVMAAVLNPR